MTTLNLRRFATPAALKTIEIGALIDLLEREGSAYVSATVPLVRDAETFDYPALALLLANPREGFPVRLADALHHINELADADGLEAMLEAIDERGLALGLGSESSPADVAVRLWLRDHELLERTHAERFIVRPKSFESWMGRGITNGPLAEPTRAVLASLEEALDDWFEKKKRGRHSKVFAFRRADATWFLVRHGQPMDRRGIIKAGESTSSFERPEKYDVLSYVPERDELNIHAQTKGEKQLYRVEIGRHLFGDPDYFPNTGKYTLAPLLATGEDSLACDDIDGIEWIKLREVKLFFGGAEPEVVTRRAVNGDLFAVLRARDKELTMRPFQASFTVKFVGAKNPRTVRLKPPNVATYQREADEDVVCRWLKAREFITAKAGDERPA
jgi:hypothetical protein